MKQTPVASECTFLFVIVMKFNFKKYLADPSDASIS